MLQNMGLPRGQISKTSRNSSNRPFSLFPFFWTFAIPSGQWTVFINYTKVGIIALFSASLSCKCYIILHSNTTCIPSQTFFFIPPCIFYSTQPYLMLYVVFSERIPQLCQKLCVKHSCHFYVFCVCVYKKLKLFF